MSTGFLPSASVCTTLCLAPPSDISPSTYWFFGAVFFGGGIKINFQNWPTGASSPTIQVLEKVNYRVFQKIFYIIFKLCFLFTQGARSLGNPDLTECFDWSACEGSLYIGFFRAKNISFFRNIFYLLSQDKSLYIIDFSEPFCRGVNKKFFQPQWPINIGLQPQLWSTYVVNAILANLSTSKGFGKAILLVST